ncbi:preprotein translocase subunit SecE [Mycoplasmopsis columbinasalis]|uniref:Preprotein translocase subunit SecE n=1 Tax=Mycoplasmopsis columbinasalis TaxID=114880 RepID=A0A449BAA3_9BACT|nr:preprotein translocase subunit SecE [Mycoplasmopsis columbinasalis]VEU78108.1 preprotein translocase subunit SecE [Mycoplasmopsis columbinasalis]
MSDKLINEAKLAEKAAKEARKAQRVVDRKNRKAANALAKKQDKEERAAAKLRKKNETGFEPKEQRKKRYFFRRFVKEIKRVQWPTSKVNWTSFWQVVIFSVAFVIIVIALASMFTVIWTSASIN